MEVSIKRNPKRAMFSEKPKKVTRWAWYVVSIVVLGALFFRNAGTSYTVCIVNEVEASAMGRLAKAVNNFPVTLVYRYVYKGQDYSSSTIKEFTSSDERKEWIAKHPVNSEALCKVEFLNPEVISVAPFDRPILHEMLDGIFPQGIFLLIGFGLMKMYFPFGFTFGPQVQYEKLAYRDLDELIKTRYQDEIVKMRELGFQEFCSYREILPKYSAVWSFFEYFEMRRSRELTRIQSPLGITLLHPLLVLPDEATYCSITAKGPWFYTRMNNGTGLITVTLKKTPSWSFYDSEGKIQVRSIGESIEETWDFHQEQLGEFRGEGISERQEQSFEDFADMAAKMDKSVLENNRWFG